MTIKITKQLATVEDLAIGTGTVVQERNGVPLNLTKIDLITASKLASSVAGEGASLVLMESGLTVEAAVVAAKVDQATTYSKTEVDALTASVSHEVGEVILFAGASAALNTKYGRGWRIADGTDGTPDLIDSFPKLGTFAQRTGTGGAKNITPAGSVSVSTSVSVLNHTLSLAQIPSHNHSYSEVYRDANGSIFSGSSFRKAISNTGSAGSSNSHNHGSSASSSGSFSGSSHTNEPQFTYLVPLYFTGVAGTYS